MAPEALTVVPSRRLVDTNLLDHQHDPRDSGKQRHARAQLRTGILAGDLCIAHQSVVAFIAVATCHHPTRRSCRA
jgi:hypothetical protein